LIQIVKKRIKGAKLNHEEETAYRRAWKTSSLIQHFGAKAIIVLSGFGVGSDTAARILRKGVEDENEVYQNIYRAEKTYVATKGFWRD
jgi:ATP-dependent Lhr-like helicase